MPIVRGAEVEFTPGIVKNYKRRILVSPERGSGAVTLGEAIMDPGAELPVHTHRVEEVMVLTRGIVAVLIGDETYTLNTGDVILAPAGVKHMLANHSEEPAEFLFLPSCRGTTHSGEKAGAVAATTDPCGFANWGFSYQRDVEPGEIVLLRNDSLLHLPETLTSLPNS